MAQSSDLKLLERSVKHFSKRIGIILSYCRWTLNTSVVVSFNNRIKAIKRLAYGYRDEDYFFLKIRAAFPGNP